MVLMSWQAATALKQAFFLEPEKSKGETKITKIV